MKNVSKKKEEEKMVGSFNKININDTKLNLKRYTNKINFIKGLIPDSFKNQNRIKNITMLHIDLNSALATEKSLNFFFKKIVSNGIIVFDDYGWKDFELTKILVDKFLRNKDGLFLQLPTGQRSLHKKMSKLQNIFENLELYCTKHQNISKFTRKFYLNMLIKKIIVVEIGVLSGGSLLMWKKFFGEKARIIGIDLNEKAKELEKYGFEIFIGDQSKPEFLENFF